MSLFSSRYRHLFNTTKSSISKHCIIFRIKISKMYKRVSQFPQFNLYLRAIFFNANSFDLQRTSYVVFTAPGPVTRSSPDPGVTVGTLFNTVVLKSLISDPCIGSSVQYKYRRISWRTFYLPNSRPNNGKYHNYCS